VQVNVLEYLEETFAKCPSKVAVVDREGCISFAELRSRARQLANRIVLETTIRNGPIAVYLPKSRNSIVAFTGILYSGNYYVPLDVKSPKERLFAIINRLGPCVIITDSVHAGELQHLDIAESSILVAGSEEQAPESIPLRIPNVIDTDPVYIMHTSGSTGVPKGVVISHRGVIDYIDWAKKCFSVTDSEIIGNQAPFYFDNSTLDIYLCFASGATLHIIPEENFSFPVRLIEYVRKHDINFIFWVPSVLASVAKTDSLGDATNLPVLTKILFAGEVMSNRHLNYWRSKYPNALFANLYGPTEITVDCTYYIVERKFADEDTLPIGFACRNSDVLILDEMDHPAAPGKRGELCVRGSSLALGYWNDQEKTASVFVQNPLNPHFPERIYRTGDLVYQNKHGEICFGGRKDSQIKHLGYRIELGEIETAMLTIAEVSNSCALYDQAKGQIVMFYEAQNELEVAFLRKMLLSRIPKYMMPSVFIYVEAIPLNINGKIDRRCLTLRLRGEA
jgi:amino acid adenylation domain-containing protein